MNEQSLLLDNESRGRADLVVEHAHGTIDDQGRCYIDGVSTRVTCERCNEWVCRRHRHKTSAYFIADPTDGIVPCISFVGVGEINFDVCCDRCDLGWEKPEGYPKTTIKKGMTIGFTAVICACILFIMLVVSGAFN